MMFYAYGYYLVVFAMAIYVIFLLHKWVMNGIQFRKEQNAILKEVLEVLRAKGSLKQ
jgi:hypothetical protein